ncbi:MAG TPA: 30S ribosomal protein S1, partial [Candidatus Angelobacter sp.]|nr:30S ribosomal protein S1 [Candidatus Angelobacter sp.]
KEGDVVTGRTVDVSGDVARIELGEGVFASCRMTAAQASSEQATSAQATAAESKPKEAKADLSSLSSMLQTRWKSGGAAGETKTQSAQAGQIRSFRISKLDPKAKKIELELVKKT